MRILLAVTLVALFATSTPLAGAESHPKALLNLSEGDLALQGYDAVAYIEQNKPVEGKKEYTVRYQGARYRFSSKKNMEFF
jgi:hypothetical protein